MKKDILDEDNDEIGYDEFRKHLDDHNDRLMKFTAHEFEATGNNLLKEIDRKKTNDNLKKDKLIKYILKREKHMYSYDDLIDYELVDIRSLYDEVKAKRGKFFKFLFGLEDYPLKS